ncbi:hypothetical protein INR49_023036 [Caranx melampygus]|nr:hypothetical protein INR49_023036 [Caranx melampygus]
MQLQHAETGLLFTGCHSNDTPLQWKRRSGEVIRKRCVCQEPVITSVSMEASAQSRAGGGLWNNPRPTPYSKETQDMLRLMMQESRLTNRQRGQINECLKNGTALPLPSDSKAASPSQPKPRKSAQKHLPAKPQRRSAESCRSGNSYIREKFHPALTILDEIEERRQFLADMASLGQEGQYIYIINSEISQRMRELAVLDKARGHKKDAVTSKRKEESAQQAENVEKTDH